MRVEFKATVVNTLHYIPTGKYKVNKKTGKTEEVKRRIVHRRTFLTALDGVSLIGARNLRIVQVRRGGKTTYSLSERKEKNRPWWEKAPPGVAKEYTRTVHSGSGKVDPPMTEEEVIRFLSVSLGGEESARRVFSEFVYGEPLQGDERWDALEPFGYERPEYEEETADAA